MPTASNRGVELAYETAGEGEAVAFVPTLGYGAWQWSWQFPAVVGPFQAIAMELRGAGTTGASDASPESQGASPGPADAPPGLDGAPPGPCDVPTLADDLEAVLADAGARRAHLVGLGLGGHVALEHAARYERARSLTLVGTTPGLPESDVAGGDLPGGLVDALHAPADDPAAVEESLSHVLSDDFRAEHPDVVEGIVEWRAEEDVPRGDWEAQVPAFTAWDRDWPPYEVTEPALIVQGGVDAVVPPANADRLAELLPTTERLEFPDAGHLVTVERSRPLNDRLVGFLECHADRE